VSTGANDVPKATGGLYWPKIDPNKKKVVDLEAGRDYMRGFDSNATEKKKIIDEILEKIPDENKSQVMECLKKSGIKDITEYGRVVHAEMEAILACTRNGISTQKATLYCTTFPCHNCAKHIIAAGVSRVVYIEPYPKSKAFNFHSDSISTVKENNKVVFEPFVGVGPRNFFNLFSMNFGSGYPLKRKNKDGKCIKWSKNDAKLRMQLLPCSYLEREKLAANLLSKYLEKINENAK
jgi:deoxycytidylate deaminase